MEPMEAYAAEKRMWTRQRELQRELEADLQLALLLADAQPARRNGFVAWLQRLLGAGRRRADEPLHDPASTPIA